MQTIAFIGLGNMGGGMAANQVKAGRTVRAFDLSADALIRAKDAGCTACGSAAEAVQGADAVITMLPAGKHVRSVYASDILPNAKVGALLVDCSTIDVESARAVATLAQEAGKGFRPADAPVSGGTAAADAGTLAFMVGCAEADFADVESVLEPMSRVTIHAGTSGAGQAAKICNNMLLGISMIGTCEAFALAERLGLDAPKFYDISSQSSGQNWSMTSYCPVEGVGPESPADRNFDGGFATDMMLKDLRLAKEAAISSGGVTPLGGQAEALYAALSEAGLGGKDFSAIMEMLKRGTVKP
ncbi:3-hydroxyisobutyrate dehydrogenase [Hyphomonas sp. FCG-A18]|uniref:3-hydroxyisobutyrate dehydrogenase n=1 Tax=Hyphomonas sp. FCG-A18 TaxID=3080019 RepID=UPI002B2B2BFD|nr:3-hydroxyisobutyrate dehydrogenase [Hyphomonas sp. FCG-A18]